LVLQTLQALAVVLFWCIGRWDPIQLVVPKIKKSASLFIFPLPSSNNRISHLQGSWGLRWVTFRVTGGRKYMPHQAAEHHHKAAEHHEYAARHHKEAARHHEAGKHETAEHHVHLANGHQQDAIHHAAEAVKVQIERPSEGLQVVEVPSTGIVTSEELVKAYARIAAIQGANIGRV
jgi:hypothetical protein